MLKFIASFFVVLFQCSIWNNSELFEQNGILYFFWYLICMTVPFIVSCYIFRKGFLEIDDLDSENKIDQYTDSKP